MTVVREEIWEDLDAARENHSEILEETAEDIALDMYCYAYSATKTEDHKDLIPHIEAWFTSRGLTLKKEEAE